MTIESVLHRAIVVDRSMSVERIGLLTNKSVNQVRKLILGEREVTVAELVVIAHALGIDWRGLLSNSGDGATH
ncbi:hypothetical protein QNA24_22245 [Rhodococcus qingshengii]|uniref:helix-turn-helix domain-containing protein n=1 Tax=Rhodococcus qingshengii TaxID=334542 RepID=UPI0024BB63B5|nr:hypothetical protein [Rhodococcus qingshengii]MDJ0489101.1 hypothetical protein [Rhodococcus qingshengii]